MPDATHPFPDFERNSAAAVAGDHLPSDLELMFGMPFHEASIHSDIAAWGRRRADDLRSQADSDAVRKRLGFLDGLIMNPGEGAIERLVAAMDPELAWQDPETRFMMLRPRVYLAYFLVPEHMAFVAGELAVHSLARSALYSRETMVKSLAWAALGREVQFRGVLGAATDFPTFEKAFRLKLEGVSGRGSKDSKG